MKDQIDRRAYRRSRAVNKVRKNGRTTNADLFSAGKCDTRTLIDTLEPRLLYSADHLLGFAVNTAQDDIFAAQDAQLHETSLELAEFYRQSTFADEQPVNDASDVFVIIDVTTPDDAVNATNMDSFADFNDGAGGDNQVSLREAIRVANNDDSVDIIRLPAGTYDLSEGRLTVMGTYIIQGAGENDTFINQGDGVNRVISIDDGSATITDLNIQGGNSGSDQSGGGVVVRLNANAYFDNVIFTNNTATSDGGGIFIEGDAEFNNVSVTGNTALQGAGVFINDTASLTIYDSSISDNVADNRAGGIFNEGMLEVHNSVISSNDVTDDSSNSFGGGGMYLVLNSTTLIDTTVISNNTATYSGGGIFNNGELFLTDSSLLENSAQVFGGGIDNREFLSAERVNVWGNAAGVSDSDNVSLGLIKLWHQRCRWWNLQ